MKVTEIKLRVSNSVLAIILAGSIFSCGKSSVKPGNNGGGGSGGGTKTDTTTAYKDPAQYGTPYANIPATKDMVMYEVNMQTYTPANFQGVQARLDSIKALGINVIWLMPTYPVGVLKSINSPYCIKDYNGVNANFGTLADLRNLVAAAHNLGMAVIMDWVANDTSWDNVWMANKAWYLQDANGNIIAPPGTNYTDVAALNFSNTAMRTAMIRAMKYWIFTANVDGYRCDFADNIPSDFWAQALDTLNTIKTHKLIYLAEGTTSAEISAGFQMDYAFSYYSTLKGVFANTQAPSALFTTNNAELSSIPSSGTKLRYITNHDDASSDGSTITEYNGKQGALAAFVLATYMNGIPLIYDSQEVGFPNPISIFTNVPVDYTANPDMVAAYKQILAFRAAHEAVKTGTFTQYNDPNVIAFEKKSGTDDVLILVNAKNSAETFTLPASLQNTTWTNGLTNTSVALTNQYALQAYGYLVLHK
jgi:glycosidase